ncbi:putative nuclear valosin-containing protein-like [Apostichopus japonicus]|uniref:Putative nuclear valosin-containing protein-like n=1 Tax=Stichopus japonicus TaxID=307972 RepID=A0A2G8LMQ0_STIJA|nr:putative nuclear valosin-containing protein-like [Apostichopus japonicus]
MVGKIHLMTFAFCITVNIADGREVLLANRLGEFEGVSLSAYDVIVQQAKDKKRKGQGDLDAFEKHHLAKRNRRDENSESEVSDSASIGEEICFEEDHNIMNKSLNNLYTDGSTPLDSPSSTPSRSNTQDRVTANSNRINQEKHRTEKSGWETLFDEGASSEEEAALREMNIDPDEPRIRKRRSKNFKESKGNQGKQGQQGAKKTAKTVTEAQTSTVKFIDVGGNDSTLQEVCKLLIHLRHPEVYQQLGVTPPRGLLLHGPPGCGKTLLAHAIAGELALPFLKVASTEIVSGVSGESEGNIRSLFLQAESLSPCILFIDEIDAVTPKRETAQREMERRIVAQLLACMDDLNKSECNVLVIGATNRVDSLDPALRRAGRFDREIAMGIPDEGARVRIMQVLCRDLKLADAFDFNYLASVTPGYVGADLMSLCREAALCAVTRIFEDLQEKGDDENEVTSTQQETVESIKDNGDVMTDAVVESKTEEETTTKTYLTVLSWLKEHPPLTEAQLSNLCIDMADFQKALPFVQPSAKREGFATIPDVTWDDVGALGNIREELTLAIVAPVRNPEAFKALGLTSPPGILLAGPPGCGKTLLAKAIANESGINFISVKGPELMNMYVGESERAVRQCFDRARNSSPCVIFFDELDALCPKRSDSAESGSTARVVNQLLTEMDGLETRKQVFIMGATNRPDIIDPAILRPGRMDKIIYVGIPSKDDRVAILKTITKNGTKPLLSRDVNLTALGEDSRCNRFTGADVASLVREASMSALQQILKSGSQLSSALLDKINVNKQDFERAFQKVKPSVSTKVRKEKPPLFSSVSDFVCYNFGFA